jgi:hypothetical protein
MSILRASAGGLAVVLALSTGACSKSPNTAWKGPGWYLELPYTVVAAGPAVYGGPYGYDACEADRMSKKNPERFLCINETKQQPKFGFY